MQGASTAGWMWFLSLKSHNYKQKSRTDNLLERPISYPGISTADEANVMREAIQMDSRTLTVPGVSYWIELNMTSLDEDPPECCRRAWERWRSAWFALRSSRFMLAQQLSTSQTCCKSSPLVMGRNQSHKSTKKNQLLCIYVGSKGSYS